jgi:hypothetical protein
MQLRVAELEKGDVVGEMNRVEGEPERIWYTVIGPGGWEEDARGRQYWVVPVSYPDGSEADRSFPEKAIDREFTVSVLRRFYDTETGANAESDRRPA